MRLGILGGTAAMAVALAIAGCAPKVVAPPPVVATLPPVYAPMPEGARANMTIPVRLADGSYATPNRSLAGDAAVWHLRTALNVAALACRGPQEAVLAAGYNQLIAQRAARMKAAQSGLSNQYKASGGDWQDRYDDAMTRLYNYWAQDFARDGFCAAAGETLTAAATQSDATFDVFAAQRLAAMDRPFTDFFAAYDAWRERRLVPRTALAAAAMQPATPAQVPQLKVDAAVLN